MWINLRAALLGILGSKKGVAAITAAAAWGIGRLGLDLPASDVAGLVGPLVAYIVGQGIADHGKEAAKMQANLDDIAGRSAAIVKKIERSLGGGKTCGDAGIGTSP